MEKKLVKVVFEYEDGTTKFLEDYDLDLWLEYNKQVSTFCEIHKMNPNWNKIKWIKTGLKKHY